MDQTGDEQMYNATCFDQIKVIQKQITKKYKILIVITLTISHIKNKWS